MNHEILDKRRDQVTEWSQVKDFTVSFHLFPFSWLSPLPYLHWRVKCVPGHSLPFLSSLYPFYLLLSVAGSGIQELTKTRKGKGRVRAGERIRDEVMPAPSCMTQPRREKWLVSECEGGTIPLLCSFIMRKYLFVLLFFLSNLYVCICPSVCPYLSV